MPVPKASKAARIATSRRANALGSHTNGLRHAPPPPQREVEAALAVNDKAPPRPTAERRRPAHLRGHGR